MEIQQSGFTEFKGLRLVYEFLIPQQGFRCDTYVAYGNNNILLCCVDLHFWLKCRKLEQTESIQLIISKNNFIAMAINSLVVCLIRCLLTT